MFKDITLEQAYKIMFTQYPDVIGTKELCEMLGGISIKKAHQIIHSGAIQIIPHSKSFLIPKISVIHFLLSVKI